MAKYNYTFTIPGIPQPITFPAYSNEDDTGRSKENLDTTQSNEGISQFFGNIKNKAILNKLEPYLNTLEKIFKERYQEYFAAYNLLNKLNLSGKIKALDVKIDIKKSKIVNEKEFVDRAISFLVSDIKHKNSYQSSVYMWYLSSKVHVIVNEKNSKEFEKKYGSLHKTAKQMVTQANELLKTRIKNVACIFEEVTNCCEFDLNLKVMLHIPNTILNALENIKK
jgi:hypothetical protein